jgi:hypothetical protein
MHRSSCTALIHTMLYMYIFVVRVSWMAKLVARLLVTVALCVRIQREYFLHLIEARNRFQGTISPAYEAFRAGTKTLFLLGS